MRSVPSVALGLLVLAWAGQPGHARTDADLREALFQEFCVTPGSLAGSEVAISASGRFGERRVIETGSRAFISYPFLGRDRTSVTLVDPPGNDLQCSVGINNVGTNLFVGGRIERE